MKQFVIGDIRIQLLSRDIVRVERRGRNGFFDGNSFFVPERSAFEGADGALTVADGKHVIVSGDVTIEVRTGAKRLNDVRIVSGKKILKLKRAANRGELPVPSRTPCFFTVCDNPRIALPDCGYAAGAVYRVEEDADDVYVLVCGGDCKKLRRLYTELTGRSELVRLSTLGFWNSRYYKHDERSARALIDEFYAYDVPLDNMVLDTDWRASSDRGIGYDVDEKLFPDMRAFFDYAHSRGVEIMFNDHPEPVAGASSALDGIEIEYRAARLTEHLNNGLDYWWYDRNWHTKLVSPTAAVTPESLGMYIFHSVTRNAFEKLAKRGKAPRRPVIMANVDNISNGSYLGIGDTASHRYSVQWTGDIGSDGASLATEIENTVKAQNSGIAYINSDCGGHVGNPTAHEYIRWMQFGAFTPVFRPHCTNSVTRFREPWAYDLHTLGIVREYIKMHYRLLPLMYRCAYENYASGAPILTPLFYEYVNDRKTAAVYDEYMIGKALLVAPLHGIMPDKVSACDYVSPVKATYYNGVEHKGEPVWSTEYPVLDLYWRHVAPNERVPVYDFSAVYETDLMFDSDAELVVESDDGATVYVDGVKTLEDKSYHSAIKMNAGKLCGGVAHKIRIEYFQGGGEAGISLYRASSDIPCNLDERRVYLPHGEWIDPFGGKIYTGGRTCFAHCSDKRMPLFVRRGGVIPLAECARNTKQMNMQNVTFEYYPSRTESFCDYLYEDDGETVAYKRGEYRKTPFSARYDENTNAMVFKLGKGEGSFAGGAKMRDVKIKYMLDGTADVKTVRVNGAERACKFFKRDTEAYPFSAGGSACGLDVLCVELRCGVDEETTVEFVLC